MSDSSLYVFPPKHDAESLNRVRRRMLRAIRLVQRGAIELREIVDNDEIIPPTPEEFDLIKTNVEERLIPYEAHLAGVINLLQFYILEVGAIYDRCLKRCTLKTWEREMVYGLWGDVEQHLGNVVQGYYVHRHQPALEPLDGYKAWDDPKGKGKAK